MPATSSRSRASRTRPPATRLCAPNAPIILERMEFPDPVIEVVGRAEDQGRPGEDGRRPQSPGAARIRRFRVSTDQESGQTIIKGMGELHLEILVDRMKREFKVEANVGAPQVAYREYLAKPVELDLHPQEAVGRLRPVRRGQGRRWSRASAARASSSSTRSRAATFRANISRRSRRACARRRRPGR